MSTHLCCPFSKPLALLDRVVEIGMRVGVVAGIDEQPVAQYCEPGNEAIHCLRSPPVIPLGNSQSARTFGWPRK